LAGRRVVSRWARFQTGDVDLGAGPVRRAVAHAAASASWGRWRPIPAAPGHRRSWTHTYEGDHAPSRPPPPPERDRSHPSHRRDRFRAAEQPAGRLRAFAGACFSVHAILEQGPCALDVVPPRLDRLLALAPRHVLASRLLTITAASRSSFPVVRRTPAEKQPYRSPQIPDTATFWNRCGEATVESGYRANVA
jgi:hypothetical protein